MKRYKPKKWFTYARLTLLFLVIFTLGNTTNVVYDVVKSHNNNIAKTIDYTIIEENKEDIYYQENPVMAKYINVPEKGFNVTKDNLKYEIPEEDYNFFVAVVASESHTNKDDILAVMSVILNRSDATGKTPVEIVTAPNQFAGYFDGYYLRYLNDDGSLNSSTSLVEEVVTDALNGVRNNNYYSFRSWGSSNYSENYIAYMGNRFN